jgi:opacity protein-like surface antigen
MNKFFKASVSASVLALFLSAPALAADLGKSSKDSPASVLDAPVSVAGGDHSGFYIKGDLGIASGDRDVSRKITGEAGKTEYVDHDDDELTDEILANVPSFVGALDSLNSSDSFEGFVFGGEISYLFVLPNRRFGIEPVVGVTFYGDAKTTHAFDGIVDGKAHEVDPEGSDPDGPDFPISANLAGFTTVDRDYDIDLILRGHLFVANNLSVYAGGGVSLARASISGYATDGDVEHSFKDSDWAPGLVLNAGLQYWATDRIVVGIDYTYKAHEFSANKSSTFGDGEECDPYLSVNDKASVDDEVHAIKARIGLKLN